MAEGVSNYDALLNSIPNPTDKCHICGRRDYVLLYRFGLAKKIELLGVREILPFRSAELF
jgi:hypothetical protein